MTPNMLEFLEKLPDLLTSAHLVEMGLYPDINATYQSRRKKTGPPYIKLRRTVLYPKKALREFLQERFVE